MNKFVAIALVAALFTVASAQNSTANATANATTGAGSGSWCRKNTDCNEKIGLCCAASSTSAVSYKQFNCQSHKNGTATVGTCVANGTDYTSLCVGEGKTCLRTDNLATYCGGSLVMAAVDAVPNTQCTSSAYSMMVSFAFFAFLALSYVF